MGVLAEVGAGLGVISVFMALGWWWLPRIILRARSRGYRGPLFEFGPWASTVVGLLGGWNVARAAEFDSSLAAGAVVAAGMVTATAAFWAAVSVLPRRSGRRPGVRSSRFPYRTAARILGVAAIAVPLTLTVLGRDLLEVVWSFALLFGLGFACAQASRRAVAPQLDRPDHLDADGTAVVLLRGFYDDRAMFTWSDRWRALHGPRRWIGYVLLDEQDFLTAEAYLGPALQASVGPLVGLGDPADHLPSGDHMLRYYAADTQWRDVMADLLPRAQAVLVLVGATESLTFELLIVRALHLQTRMFLVLPPQQPTPVRVRLPPPLRRSAEPPVWPSHTQFFRVLGYELPHEDPGQGR